MRNKLQLKASGDTTKKLQDESLKMPMVSHRWKKRKKLCTSSADPATHPV